MSNKNFLQTLSRLSGPTLKIGAVFLFVEFLDELVDGVKGAAMPSIRSELGLTYIQVGMLLSVPHFAGCAVEPLVGLLGDIWRRDRLVKAGGIVFAVSLILVGLSSGFAPLLCALMLFNPASGTFVGLSQASLMDLRHARREEMMARWAFCGSAANVTGPLLLTAAVNTSGGWRSAFIAIGILSLAAVGALHGLTWEECRTSETSRNWREAVAAVLPALRKQDVLKTLVALECADLMLDVFTAFLALYMVDVLQASIAEAGAIVMLRAASGMFGDLAMIWFLRKMDGPGYLRFSALIVIALYLIFLSCTSIVMAGVFVVLIGLTVSGWYAVLKASLYAALPENSGTAMGVSSLCSLLGGVLPWSIGWLAEVVGLPVAMYALFLGPLSILLLVPGTDCGKSPEIAATEDRGRNVGHL